MAEQFHLSRLQVINWGVFEIQFFKRASGELADRHRPTSAEPAQLRERLQRVAEQVLPLVLQRVGARADPLARRGEKERDGVERASVLPRPDEVGEAEPLARRLSREVERRDCPSTVHEVDRVPLRVRLEIAIHGARSDPSGAPDALDVVDRPDLVGLGQEGAEAGRSETGEVVGTIPQRRKSDLEG